MSSGRPLLVVPIFCLIAPLLCFGNDPIPDVLSEEIAKFQRLAASPGPPFRVEAAQIARHLRLQDFEPELVKLLDDEDALVRREAIQALIACGTWKCVEPVIAKLDEREWAIREHARLALRQLTGETSDWRTKQEWQTWWTGSTLEAKQEQLFNRLLAPGARTPDEATNERSARALRSLATPAIEDKVLKALTDPNPPRGNVRVPLTETLARIGGPRSLPYLRERAMNGDNAAAWALGARGGKEAEAALLKGFQRNRSMDFMLNLDRVHSTQCGPYLRSLCQNFHSVIRAGKGEELRYPVSPLRRVSANLIRRSGSAPMLVDLILRELEGRPDEAAIPEDLRPMFCDLRQILKPEFLREGFSNCDPLLGALQDVADSPSLVPRLIPLLRSDCLLGRIYAALTLGRLRSHEAIGPILDVIKEGYPFSDTTAVVSAKHTGTFVEVEGRKERQSQTVRWLGYLCSALGEIGGEESRKALEDLATNPESPHDVRYASVVALGVIASKESVPVLRAVSDKDTVFMVRDIAKRSMVDIEAADTTHRTHVGQGKP